LVSLYSTIKMMHGPINIRFGKCFRESYWQSLELSHHFFTWEQKEIQLAKRYVLLRVRTEWRSQAVYRVASEHFRTDMPDRLLVSQIDGLCVLSKQLQWAIISFVMSVRPSDRVEQIASHRTDLPETDIRRFYKTCPHNSFQFTIRQKALCIKTYLHWCVGSLSMLLWVPW